eukprot:SAG31_NODE_1483_length_8166_cov_5.059874_6_plen_68_part_00
MLRPDLAARIPGHFHLPAEGIRPGYSAVGEAVDVAAAALRSLGVLAANRKVRVILVLFRNNCDLICK